MTVLRVAALVSLLAILLALPDAGGPLAVGALWAGCLALLAFTHPDGMLSLGALYLLQLGLFHLGLVVPLALGATVDDPPAWLGSPHLPAALRLVAIAAVAFTLGARLRPAPAAAPRSGRPQPELFWVGLAVAAVGAPMLWIGVVRLGIMDHGYIEYFARSGSTDVRFFGFGMMLFPIGLLVAAAGATPRRMYALAAIVLAVMGPLFLRGFRGPTIVQAAALLAVWVRKDPRVARRVAVLAVLAVVVLVPAVRATRDAGEGVSAEKVKADPLAVVTESGGSLFPLVVTIERIDRRAEPRWNGRSYVMAIERILPNVAAQRSMVFDADQLAPNAWATLHGDPWAFDHGGGIGFSGVAEPYLNFGVAGVVVFFVLLGALVQGWERATKDAPFRAALGAATFGFLLWTVRNDSLELFRPLAFAAATVLGAWVLAGWNARAPRRAREPIAPPRGAAPAAR